METRHKISIGAIALLLVLAIGAVGSWILWQNNQGQGIREDILVSLPGPPDNTRFEPAMVRAIERAYQAIEENPDPVAGLGQLARLYQANGLLGEAIQALDLLLNLDPDNPKWPHMLAFILAGYGELEVALPLWERTMELEPDYLPAHLRRAEALLKLNRPEDAKDAFLVVLIKDAENPHALHGLARIAFADEDYQTAYDYLSRSMDSSNGRIGIQLIVTTLDRLGRTKEANALRGMAKALEKYSDIPDPWISDLMDDCYDPYQLISGGGVAVYAGDTERGIRLIERAIQLDEDNASAYFQLGRIYQDNGNPEKAILNYEKATTHNPQLSDAWLHRADLFIELGLEEKGDELLAMGLIQNPNSPALHLRWGQRLKEKGRTREAVPQFLKSIELRPQEPEAYLALAIIYLDFDEPEKARKMAMDSLDAEAFNPIALSTLTVIAISMGNEEEALEWLEKTRLQPRIKQDEQERLLRYFQQAFGYRPEGW